MLALFWRSARRSPHSSRSRGRDRIRLRALKRGTTLRLPFISILILTAALAALPAEASTKVPKITVAKSAATLAMTSVDSGEIHLTNVRVNGQSIGQPVATGSTVQLTFDWTVSAIPGCPFCNIQGYVGFQGTAATCFAFINPAPDGGSFSGTLTAPAKPGTYLIMINETVDLQCDAVTSGGGGLPSIAAVVATLKVKAPAM